MKNIVTLFMVVFYSVMLVQAIAATSFAALLVFYPFI